MPDIQRDMGRFEATQEIMKEDVKQIKRDIADIKEAIYGREAVSAWNWKLIGSISGISIIFTQLISYVKIAIASSLP